MAEYECLNLILGDQLNWDSELWEQADKHRDVCLMAEVVAESTSILSSKQRTVLFFSAMRHFADEISQQGYQLIYIPIQHRIDSLSAAITKTISEHAFKHIRCVLPGDYRVKKALDTVASEHKLTILWLYDRHFIADKGEFSQWMAARKQPRMEYWYRHLRQSRGILMQQGNQPEGGRWNYDKDNRKSFKHSGPELPYRHQPTETDAITTQVIEDVETELGHLPGNLQDFPWPVTRQQALEALTCFIQYQLQHFGDYQDAMWQDEPYLYHSLLSSSLNLKLLNPREVISSAEQAYHTYHLPLNAVEGFIRQILGWREYIHGLYWSYRENWLNVNALNANKSLPAFYWHANTEMNCLQQSIQQVLDVGYGHHIQRLMVTGLFALLWGVAPKQIHEWYLAMYVDAVAWVEIPNTIGMSQYADGGIVGSKPYIASGAYINRMSNYCQTCPYHPEQATGEDACPFTTLYWQFIADHQDWLSHHPRLGMQVKNWLRKSEQDKQAITDRYHQLQKAFTETL